MRLRAGFFVMCAVAAVSVATSGCTGSGTSAPLVTATTAISTPAASGTPSSAPSTVPTTTPSPSPTPTTAPTATPTPTATPVAANIQLAPNPVQPFPAVGGCSAIDANFTASESGYSGSFSAVSNDTSKATVSPATSANGVFTVHAVAVGTTTTITVHDANNNTATEQVQISSPICLP